jgi:hypothetical protein
VRTAGFFKKTGSTSYDYNEPCYCVRTHSIAKIEKIFKIETLSSVFFRHGSSIFQNCYFRQDKKNIYIFVSAHGRNLKTVKI